MNNDYEKFTRFELAQELKIYKNVQKILEKDFEYETHYPIECFENLFVSEEKNMKYGCSSDNYFFRTYLEILNEIKHSRKTYSKTVSSVFLDSKISDIERRIKKLNENENNVIFACVVSFLIIFAGLLIYLLYIS